MKDLVITLIVLVTLPAGFSAYKILKAHLAGEVSWGIGGDDIPRDREPRAFGVIVTAYWMALGLSGMIFLWLWGLLK